jgi:hypothetical protein
VRFFRRKETLNERLLREAGLSSPPEAPDSDWSPAPAFDRDVGVHGRPQPRRWDAVVTVDVPDLPGDAAEFTTVPDGTLIVGESEERDLGPLANAVERELEPPYRAEAVRRGASLWAVSANRIAVVALKADGEVIDLAVHDGERTASVDGQGTSRAYPELERLGEREARDYAIHAERLDGDLWEVQVSAL